MFLNNFILIELFVLFNFETIFSINQKLVTTRGKNTNAAKMVTKIIKICYRDDFDKVVLAGDWDDFQIWHRYFPTSMSFKIFAAKKERKQHKRERGAYKLNEDIVKKLYYPARLFLIAVPDHYSLQKIIEMLKMSIIWNSRAFFILIEKNNSCSKPALLIKTIWQNNILNAIYLCNGSEGAVNFYNFNPYTSHTVKPWKLVDAIIDENRNHTISIFHFSTWLGNFNANLCNLVNFDKTRTIGNYPITMSGALSEAQVKNITEIKDGNFLEDFCGLDIKINKIIWEKLGANPTVAIYQDGYIDSEHVPHGSIKEVIEEKYDMSVNQHYLRNFWRLETYPHSMGGIYAMSLEKRPNIDSRLEISEPAVFVALLSVSIFTILALRYYLKLKITHALVVNFQLLLGISTSYEGSKKLFFIYLTFVAFFLNLMFQCSLSSSLVIPHHAFKIDNSKDLLVAIRLKYEIFGPEYVREFLDDIIGGVFQSKQLDKCRDLLSTRPKSVCLGEAFTVNEYAKYVKGVYISKQKIEAVSRIFIVREDWPLKTRVNFLIGQLKESGIINLLTVKNLEVVEAHRNENNDAKNLGQFRSLSLKSLDFSVYILFAGWIVALCVFITEQIKMSRYRRMGKHRNKLNNLNIFKQNQP